jgi:hypothetical protein
LPELVLLCRIIDYAELLRRFSRKLKKSPPKEPIEELWQMWGRPDIWRLPHGHISKGLVPGLTSRILRWLSPRLNAPTALAPSKATTR